MPTSFQVSQRSQALLVASRRAHRRRRDDAFHPSDLSFKLDGPRWQGRDGGGGLNGAPLASLSLASMSSAQVRVCVVE
jgi:hypothetical protein